jgi:hypothetical protein
LDNAWSLLAPGGLLLLYETTQHPTWFEVSIGLIEGWSRFHDDWRQGNPLLSPAKWQEALLAHGFTAVQFWPPAGAAAEVLGVHIVLAQAPAATAGDGRYQEAPALSQASEQPVVQATNGTSSAAGLLTELREALPADQLDLLVDYVRQQVLKVTRSDAARVIGRRDRLMDLGVDSLMAVELRTVLSSGLDLEQSLPATLIFDYPSIEAIATHLQQVLFACSPETETVPEVQDPAGSSTTNIADLSEEEVEALLLQKLGEI